MKIIDFSKALGVTRSVRAHVPRLWHSLLGKYHYVDTHSQAQSGMLLRELIQLELLDEDRASSHSERIDEAQTLKSSGAPDDLFRAAETTHVPCCRATHPES